MKKLLLLLVLLCTVSASMGQRLAPSQNALRVNILSGDKQNVTVRSIGNGQNEAQCQQDAQIKAIKAVLYVGLSSPDVASSYNALITKPDQSADYFTSFFDNETYKRYITSSQASSSLDRVKGQKQREQAFDIVIQIGALETMLRKDKIIQRMGLQ